MSSSSLKSGRAKRRRIRLPRAPVGRPGRRDERLHARAGQSAAGFDSLGHLWGGQGAVMSVCMQGQGKAPPDSTP